MHDHIARIQRYLLVIKEQYETIHATLLHTAPEKSTPNLRAHAHAYTALLMHVNNSVHMHDELIGKVQAYIDTFVTDADIPATRAPEAPSTDATPSRIDGDDEWMFQYEIDKAAEEDYADDAYSYDDDSIDMSDRNDDDGEDDEEDTVPLTVDQAYIKRLNQARPLILETGFMSEHPAEDFAVELSDQEYRNLFGLDGSTLKRPMNAVEALGVFGFVFSAEEQQRLLVLDGDPQSSSVAEGAEGAHLNDEGADDASTNDWSDDGPDYNIPGAA